MPSERDLGRLPIDVLASGADRAWRPDPLDFPSPVAEYERLHREALAHADFPSRARALWGLIAHGDEAIPWARDALSSRNTDLLEDALSVFGWLGVPADLVTHLTSLLDTLPDSELRSVIHSVLPESVIAAHDAADKAVDSPGTEGVPLDGAMDPFTEVIYFVRAPYEEVAAAMRQAWGRHGRAHEHRGKLAALLTLLEPYAHLHFKALAVECQSGWSAIFDQGADLTYADRFPTALRTLGIRTAYSPQVRRQGRIIRHGDTAFWMTDGSRQDLGPLFRLRSIQASYQSGWDWHASGEVQPWEDTERYGRKRVGERFDLPLMNRYCQALGIRRGDADFYGPRGTLTVQDTRSWPNKPEGISSAEWRRQHQPA